MLAGLSGKAAGRLVQKALGVAQMFIGNSLFFPLFRFASQMNSKLLAGGIELLHGGDPVALVIMVSHGKLPVSLAHQLGWVGMNVDCNT